MFPFCYNNFLNLFNRIYPIFKFFEGIKILNTKTKTHRKEKCRTQNKERKTGKGIKSLSQTQSF